MKRYDVFGASGYSAECEDGDFVRFEDAQAELKIQDDANDILTRDNKSLRDELTAANLERDALKQALVKVADPNIIRTSESFRQIALDALEPK